jgi:predicted phage terminase large subunit-like protein
MNYALDNDISELLSYCSISTEVLAKTFFPERFYLEFSPEIHGKIFDLIDGPCNKVVIAAPRGWGKTSIVALALNARWILFNHTGFICYINKSHDAASLQTENLRREMVTNRIIKHFFGDFKQREVKKSEFDEVFSKKAWVAYDTLVWPRGAGQQVRGVLFKNDRPGLFVIDDLEDPNHIENKDYRDKLHEWLYADVVKAVPRIGPQAKNYKIVYIDTLKHEDSTLQKLLDSPEWESVRIEACDDNFKSAAPGFMSDEEIQKEWQAHVDSGQTDVFFREMRNLPISTKDSSFQDSYFKYYNLPLERTFRPEIDLKLTDAELQLSRDVETVVILDPAKTKKIHSAESAIIGIGVDVRHARLFIRDIVSEKLYPDEIYDEFFGMCLRLGVNVAGVEETSLNEFIKQPIKSEMFRRGKFFEIIWLKARGGQNDEKGKVLRIREMVPYYRMGYVYHNASCPMTKNLEQQLRMFPRSKLWDIMDAEAYILEMLELGQRYFVPKDYDPNNPESEYAELEYEDPVDDWRTI